MPLTSELDNPNSPARKFLEEKFPNTRAVTRDANALLRRAETIKPNTDVPHGTLGTAFDYRARYYFRVTPSRELIAWRGAVEVGNADMLWVDAGGYDWWDETRPTLYQESENSEVLLLRKFDGRTQKYTGSPLIRGIDQPQEDGPISSGLVRAFFAGLDDTLEQIGPSARLLERHDEELLNRYCIGLALFEEFTRPGAAHAQSSSPLLRCLPGSTAEDLLGIAGAHWVDDLCRLSQTFFQAFQDRFYDEAILNPTFAGSPDVGGADADLILDDCLVEFKTTIKDEIEKVRTLYQLIGYSLLDYDDEFGLGRLGVYMARQGEFIEWPIVNLFERLMGQKPPPLQDLRREFRDAVISRR